MRRRRAWLLVVVLVCCVVVLIACQKTAQAPAGTAMVPDPTGDLLDVGAVRTTGEAYMDITNTRLALTGGYYTARIEVAGVIPKAAAPGIFVEWDLLIDADRNPATGTAWPLVGNDIGYDYLIRVSLDSESFKQLILATDSGVRGNINYRVDEKAVELYFTPAVIGEPAAFDFVIATRKYRTDDQPGSPVAVDKAPAQGHYAYPR